MQQELQKVGRGLAPAVESTEGGIHMNRRFIIAENLALRQGDFHAYRMKILAGASPRPTLVNNQRHLYMKSKMSY